jgi:hypothetical protein
MRRANPDEIHLAWFIGMCIANEVEMHGEWEFVEKRSIGELVFIKALKLTRWPS